MAMTTLRSGTTIDNKVGLDETIPTSPTEAKTSKVSEKEKVTLLTFPSEVSKAKERKATYGYF
jgi:hypothetical protein